MAGTCALPISRDYAVPIRRARGSDTGKRLCGLVVRLCGITAGKGSASDSPSTCDNRYAAEGVDIVRISPPEKPQGYSALGKPEPHLVRDSDNGDKAPAVVTVVTVTEGESEYEWGQLGIPDTRTRLPLGSLPKQLADFVRAASESLQVPTDLVFLLMLGVMAAATRGRIMVQPKPHDPGHVEPCALYVAAFMDQGERKTPTLSLVSKPLREAEADLIRESRLKVRQSEETFTRLTDQVKQARGKCVKDPGNVELQAEYDEAQNSLHNYVPVIAPQLIGGDITPERIPTVMSEQGGSFALISDEGGTLKNLAGRYSEGGANLDAVNQGFSGGAIKVDRQGRERVVIEHAHLVIVLAVQPDVAREIKGNTEMKDRGLLDRFLVTQPQSLVGERKFRTDPVPAHIADQWNYSIKALVSESTKLLSEGEYRTLTATPDSCSLYEKWWNNTEPRLGAEGDLSQHKGWVSKFEGILPRIAALFAVIENAKATQVEVGHMEAALSLWEYSLGQVQFVFGYPVTGSRAKVLAAIKDFGQREFTVREIHRKVKGEAERVKTDLAHLQGAGYVRHLPMQGTRKDRWEAHPELNK